MLDGSLDWTYGVSALSRDSLTLCDCWVLRPKRRHNIEVAAIDANMFVAVLDGTNADLLTELALAPNQTKKECKSTCSKG